MLSIYRRHKPNCKHADDRMSKKCRCALWATGTLAGEPYRKSLKTRNWERAEQIIRELEGATAPEAPNEVTVKDALAAFIKDCESRNLNRTTRVGTIIGRLALCDILEQFKRDTR